MPFATFAEFKHFLDGASVALTGKRASTHKSKRHEPRVEASDLNWWRSTDRSDGVSPESRNRNRAYLISYFELVEESMPVEGVRLPDGSFVWPDRSVVERSLRDGHLRFDPCERSFILTDEGRGFAHQSEPMT